MKWLSVEIAELHLSVTELVIQMANCRIIIDGVCRDRMDKPLLGKGLGDIVRGIRLNMMEVGGIDSNDSSDNC